MDARLRRYFGKKIHGGRSLAARAVDFVMLRAFLFLLIGVVIFYLSLSLTVSAVMSLFLTAAVSIAVSLLNRKREDVLIKKAMQRLKEKCMLRKLTFMPSREYADFIGRVLDCGLKNVIPREEGFFAECEDFAIFAFQNHPGCECGANDVLKILREKSGVKLIIAALSGFSDDAKKMCAALPCEIKLIDGKKILELAKKKELLPDEREAERDAEKEMNASLVTFEAVRKNALSRAKIRGYLFCGVIIMCWPVVAGFQFYYPLISAACFALALLAYRRTKKQQNDGIS